MFNFPRPTTNALDRSATLALYITWDIVVVSFLWTWQAPVSSMTTMQSQLSYKNIPAWPWCLDWLSFCSRSEATSSFMKVGTHLSDSNIYASMYAYLVQTILARQSCNSRRLACFGLSAMFAGTYTPTRVPMLPHALLTKVTVRVKQQCHACQSEGFPQRWGINPKHALCVRLWVWTELRHIGKLQRFMIICRWKQCAQIARKSFCALCFQLQTLEFPDVRQDL